MKKYYGRVLCYEMIGIIVISVLGFLWHSFYEVFDSNPIVGLFCPVNESYWEHIKIIFFPWWLYAIFEFPFIKDKVNNFFFSKMIGLIVFEFVSLGIVYLIDQIIGSHNFTLTIIMFIIGLVLGLITSYYLLTSINKNKVIENIGMVLFMIQILVIFIFTLNPPRLDFFKDSQTGTFGIYKYTR